MRVGPLIVLGVLSCALLSVLADSSDTLRFGRAARVKRQIGSAVDQIGRGPDFIPPGGMSDDWNRPDFNNVHGNNDASLGLSLDSQLFPQGDLEYLPQEGFNPGPHDDMPNPPYFGKMKNGKARRRRQLDWSSHDFNSLHSRHNDVPQRGFGGMGPWGR